MAQSDWEKNFNIKIIFSQAKLFLILKIYLFLIRNIINVYEKLIFIHYEKLNFDNSNIPYCEVVKY